MASARNLKKQADRCAALAQQTHDEDARLRYRRLEQMYLQLAEAEVNTGDGRVDSAA